MNATITLERHDGGAFQVTAGVDGGPGSDRRHLTFAVPGTNDSLRLDWRPNEDFTSGGPVEVALRIGTMPAQRAAIKDGELLFSAPPGPPRFGPGADGILDALRDAFQSFLVAHPETVEVLRQAHPTLSPPLPGTAGKAGKDVLGDAVQLVGTVAQYAAAGAATGVALTGDASGAVAGAAVGVVVGVLVTATQ